MQATRHSWEQDSPACFHKYLVKFTIEKLWLRIPQISSVTVSLRIGTRSNNSENEEVYGKRKVRIEQGKCDLHEKLQLFSTLRYNKVSGHHENAKVNKSIAQAVLSVYAGSATGKNVVGVCNLNLDQLINSKGYGVVRAPLERCSDISASIDFGVQAIFVESMDQPSQKLRKSSKDNQRTRFQTPNDSKDTKDFSITPKNAHSGVSGSSSSQNSSMITPKRSVGKFSKAKRSPQSPLQEVSSKRQTHRGSGLGAALNLLDTLKTSDSRLGAEIENRLRQKHSGQKPNALSYRPSIDFESRVMMKSSTSKQLTDPVDSSTESQADNHRKPTDWQDKFRMVSSKLVLSEMERERLAHQLAELSKQNPNAVESQQLKHQVSSLQKQVDTLQKLGLVHNSEKQLLQEEIASLTHKLVEAQKTERRQGSSDPHLLKKEALAEQQQHQSNLVILLKEAQAETQRKNASLQQLASECKSLREESIFLKAAWEAQLKFVQDLSDQMQSMEHKQLVGRSEPQPIEGKRTEESTQQEETSVHRQNELEDSPKSQHLQRAWIEEKRQLVEQIQSLGKRLQEKTKSVERLQQQAKSVGELKSKLQASEQLSKANTDQLGALQRDLMSSNRRVSELKSQLQEESQEHQLTRRKMDELVSCNAALQENLTRTQQTCQKEIEMLRLSISDQAKLIEYHNRSLVEAIKKLKQMAESVDKSTEPIVTVNDEPHEDDWMHMLLIIDELQQSIAQMLTSHEVQVEQLQVQLKQIEEELAVETRHSTKYLDNLPADMAENSIELNRSIENCSQVRLQHDSKIIALTEQIATLKQLDTDKDVQHADELSSLKRHYEQILSERACQTRQETEQMKYSQLTNASKEATALKETVEQLKHQLRQKDFEQNNLQEEFNALAAANSKLQYKILALTALKNEHDREVERLQTELEEMSANPSPRTGLSFMRRNSSPSPDDCSNEDVQSLRHQLGSSQRHQDQLKRSNHELHEKCTEQTKLSERLAAQLQYVIGACGIINNKLLQHIDPSAPLNVNWSNHSEKISDLFSRHLQYNLERLIKAHRHAEQDKKKLEQDLQAQEHKSRELSQQLHQDTQRHHQQHVRFQQELHKLQMENIVLQNERSKLSKQLNDLIDRQNEEQAESLYFTEMSKLDNAVERHQRGVQTAAEPKNDQDVSIVLRETAMQTIEIEVSLKPERNHLRPIAKKRGSLECPHLQDDMEISGVDHVSPRMNEPTDTLESDFDRLQIHDPGLWQTELPPTSLLFSNRQEVVQRQLEEQVERLKDQLRLTEEERTLSKSALLEESEKLKFELEHIKYRRIEVLLKVEELNQVLTRNRNVFVEICRTETQAKQIIDYYRQVQRAISEIKSLIGNTEGTATQV